MSVAKLYSFLRLVLALLWGIKGRSCSGQAGVAHRTAIDNQVLEQGAEESGERNHQEKVTSSPTLLRNIKEEARLS